MVKHRSRSRSISRCVKQTTKRYTQRDGPPYPANQCPPHSIRRGGNGRMYINVADKHGTLRWYYKTSYKKVNGTYVLKSSLNKSH